MPDSPIGSSANPGDTPREEKKLTNAERRRCPRVNSQVPVTVEWSAEGQSFRQGAQTRIIGRYGCLVVLPYNLEVDQHVHVTNMASKQANPAVVVWRGHRRSEGWELGIELINPDGDFWGFEW